MRRRWPRANYVEDSARTAPLCARIFDKKLWREDRPLRVVLIGTDFEVRVWETLLRIPMGRATTYSDIAGNIGRPKARARGRRRGRQEPDPLRGALPPRHRQIRRADRLSLGPDPQARHAGLGGGHGGGLTLGPRLPARPRFHRYLTGDERCIEAEAPPRDAGRPRRLGLARGDGRQRRPPGQTRRRSTGCGPPARTRSCAPTAARSGCRRARWAIPRSATSTSAPAAW